MGVEERIVRGVGEMDSYAKEVAEKVKAGDVLLLYGDLGAGKTTFVQALARELGVDERVTSPTFTVVSEYEVAGENDIDVLWHVDLYRLDDRAERDPAVADVLERAATLNGVTVIEWADRLTKPVGRSWQLCFSYGEKNEERIVSGFEKGRLNEL